jgi:hypothetical protein
MTEIIRASGEALTAGIQRHSIEGVHVPITVPAKTVADCFKYRSRVGLDVAMEALRECLRYRRASIDDIIRFARICRVENVMRPYVEPARRLQYCRQADGARVRAVVRSCDGAKASSMVI